MQSCLIKLDKKRIKKRSKSVLSKRVIFLQIQIFLDTSNTNECNWIKMTPLKIEAQVLLIKLDCQQGVRWIQKS